MTPKPRRLKQALWTVGIVLTGVVILVLMTMSRPPMARKKQVIVHPPAQVFTVHTARQRVMIHGEGTVAPLRQSNLATQVAGQVVWVSDSLTDGGSFDKGEVLLKIDPRDYKLAITQARAKVKEAETTLQLKQEEAKAALEEWRRMRRGGRKDGEQPSPLVAKKPQLASARAGLEAARANLEVAKLALARTEIKAPYQGRVVSKTVDLGQYLRGGDKVATIFCTEAAEITVYLESSAMGWLDAPGLTQNGKQGSPATVEVDFAGSRLSWNGHVVRTGARVDERTRLVPVVVRVEKPYARRPPLTVGLFAKVTIMGRELDSAALIPRSSLRQGDVVWVVDKNNALQFRKVSVAHFQRDMVMIRSGLKDGERVVVSSLGEVTNGMLVRPVALAREDNS